MASKDETPAYLDQAVSSILAQSFADFELVLVDDGSSNPARKQRYAEWAARDSRIRLLIEPNRGLAGALNYGLYACRGEYVARHDSDDWSLPNRLALQLGAFEADPSCVLVGSQAWSCRANGAPLWQTHLPLDTPGIRAYFSHANPFVHGSTMFRRDAALRVGGYREELNGAEDYDFFWRLSAVGSVSNLPHALYWHRKTGTSVSALHAEKQTILVSVIRQLGAVRQSGGHEDIGAAYAQIMHSRPLGEWRGIGLCRRADQCLLAGSTGAALNGYICAIVASRTRFRALLGLIRALLFVSLPLMKWRQRLFRA